MRSVGKRGYQSIKPGTQKGLDYSKYVQARNRK